MMINGHSARAEKTTQKNAPLPLNDFINAAPNLIDPKKLLQVWIYINKMHKLQEIYAASIQVVHCIILVNYSDPANITDFSIINLLQEDTLAPAKNVSVVDISSTVPPKSLKSHHEMTVNYKAIWDMA